jgi:hypothetical protein
MVKGVMSFIVSKEYIYLNNDHGMIKDDIYIMKTGGQLKPTP